MGARRFATSPRPALPAVPRRLVGRRAAATAPPPNSRPRRPTPSAAMLRPLESEPVEPLPLSLGVAAAVPLWPAAAAAPWAAGAAVTLTCGAGESEPGAPIQRTISPLL